MSSNKNVNMGIVRIGLLAFLFCTLAALGTVHAQTTGAADGALSLYNLVISPQPVVSGGNVSISFQLFNSYQNPLTDVNLQITADNPILNVSPTSSAYIYSIGTGAYGGIGYNSFAYKFHIPATVEAGEYTIDVVATYATSTGEGSLTTDTAGESTMPINLYIYGQPKLQLSASPVGQISPGGQSTMQISVINSGTDTARLVSIRILNSSNFTAYGSPVLNFGILAPGTSASQTAVLQTAYSLPTGTVNIPVLESYTAQSGQNFSINASIPVSFVTGAPQIITSIQSANPPQLYPGSNQTVAVLIQNTGYSTAENLSVSFLNSAGVTIGGTTSNFFIGNLAAGASVSEQVLLNANSNANFTNYAIPVKISYTGLNHANTTTFVEQMPLNIQASSEFNVTAVGGALTPGGTYQPLVFTIKNIGNEPAQELSLVLETVYPLSPANPNYYVSQLLPGQSVNATFYVSTDSNGKNGTYPVTIYEVWRQPNGYTTQQYSGSTQYYANVSGPGGAASSGNLVYGVVAVVVIIGIVAYRYRKVILKRFANKKS